MKYILVHWTATNETSILTEEFVRDKSLLQDTRKEGMIRFGDLNAKEPKDGWKSYLGRVVFVHERKSVVKKRETDFLDEENNVPDSEEENAPQLSLTGEDEATTAASESTTGEARRTSRKRKAVPLSFSDSEQSDHSTVSIKTENRKKKNLKKVAQEKAFKAILQNESGDESDSSLDELTTDELKSKISKLKSELDKERKLVKLLRESNMILQTGLPDLLQRTCQQAIIQSQVGAGISKVRKVEHRRQFSTDLMGPSPLSFHRQKENGEMSSRSPSPAASNSRSTSPATSSSRPTSPAASNSRSSSPPCAQEDKEVVHVGDKNADQHDQKPAPSLLDFASPVQIAEVNNAKTHKKMAGVLSCVLFERSVLAASSVTGKSKEGRPALDPEKVQLIIAHIRSRFPNCPVSDIKAVMAQKCKDERIAREARRKKAEKEENTEK